MQKFVFVGVSVEHSLVPEIFSRWYQVLGLRRNIKRISVPLGSGPDVYSALAKQFFCDTDFAGGLITSHKIQMYEHGCAFFSYVDKTAHALQEISTIKRGKKTYGLYAYAQDSCAIGSFFDMFVDYAALADIGSVYILGAGGAARALCAYIASPKGRKLFENKNIFVMDTGTEALQRTRNIIASGFPELRTEFVHVRQPADTSAAIHGFCEPVMVINATGVGKDVLGSPLKSEQIFPEGSILWDLNYRGDFSFLRNAECHNSKNSLILKDGWDLALCGWMHVLETVEDIVVFGNSKLLCELRNKALVVRQRFV